MPRKVRVIWTDAWPLLAGSGIGVPTGGRERMCFGSCYPPAISMDDPVQLREYREDDAAAVRACIVELQEYERTIDWRLRPGTSIAARYLVQMLDRCRAYAGQIFVVDYGDVVAGFVTVLAAMPFEELDDPPGEYALISDLVVLERFRRLGYATALLKTAEEYALVRGASELRIGVLSANRAARQLYIRAGFNSHAEVLTKRLNQADTNMP